MSAAPVQSKPFGANYSDSRSSESLLEKLIRERGGELPRVKPSEVSSLPAAGLPSPLCLRIMSHRQPSLKTVPVHASKCLVHGDAQRYKMRLQRCNHSALSFDIEMSVLSRSLQLQGMEGWRTSQKGRTPAHRFQTLS